MQQMSFQGQPSSPSRPCICPPMQPWRCHWGAQLLDASPGDFVRWTTGNQTREKRTIQTKVSKQTNGASKQQPPNQPESHWTQPTNPPSKPVAASLSHKPASTAPASSPGPLAIEGAARHPPSGKWGRTEPLFSPSANPPTEKTWEKVRNSGTTWNGPFVWQLIGKMEECLFAWRKTMGWQLRPSLPPFGAAKTLWCMRPELFFFGVSSRVGFCHQQHRFICQQIPGPPKDITS